MPTILREEGASPRVDRISFDEIAENIDLAGRAPSPEALHVFFQRVLDQLAEMLERGDDLAIDLLVQLRDERDTGRRIPLEEFLEQRGLDVSQLESELDAEDE